MLNSAISVRGRDLVLLGLVALSSKVLLSQVLAGVGVALSSISRGLRDFLDRDSNMKEITREFSIWNVHHMPSLRLLGIPNRASAANIFFFTEQQLPGESIGRNSEKSSNEGGDCSNLHFLRISNNERRVQSAAAWRRSGRGILPLQCGCLTSAGCSRFYSFHF